jgi:hypothetical protein
MTQGIQRGAAAGIDDVAELAGKVWYWYLIAGIISLVFGIIVLSNILTGLAALVWLAGLYLIYAGIVDLTGASVIRPRWVSAIIGVLAIAGGILSLTWPGVTLTVLAWLLGSAFIIWGAARALGALGSRGDGWVWSFIAGAAIAVVGFIALVYPGLTVVVLAVLLGVNSLIWGVFAIVQSLMLRRLGREG